MFGRERSFPASSAVWQAPRSTKWPLRAADAVLVLGTAVSCGSSSMTPPSIAADAAAICPATIDLTVGRGCAAEGLRCAPEYTCGVTTAIVSCVCTNGTFQCGDGAGKPLAAGVTPACPVALEAGTCPATEQSAQLAPCAEPGLLCAYPSTCPSALDSCQCFFGKTTTGQLGLRFECNPRICASPDAAIPANAGDATMPTSPAEGGTTPAGDAASASDSTPTMSGVDGALPLDAASRSETGAPDAQLIDATGIDASSD